MNWRKVIGWFVFSFGILYFFIAPAATADYSTSYPWTSFPGGLTLHILVAALTIGGGWIISHPKKTSGDKPSVQKVNIEKEKHEIWTIYYREFASADPQKQPEIQWRINEWQKLMKQGLSPREAYKTSRLLDFNAYLRKEYNDKA